MSGNRISERRDWKNRRKRQLRRHFLISSAAAVTVFLLVLGYALGNSEGKEEPTSSPAESQTEHLPPETGLTAPAPTESIYLDVTPPKGKAKEALVWWDEEELHPEEFLESMEDDTEITVTFQTMPDMELFEQEQEVAVCLTDEGGNQTVLQSRLTLMHDDEPPVMKGVYNLTVFIGDTILFRKGVEVTDNHDEQPKLTIDSSQLNRNQEGTYDVVYRVEDKAGNVTEETIFVTVMEKVAVTQEMVDALADKILAGIFTEGMTNREKAYAIYWWTRRNIAYTGHTDPSDIVAGAYQGLRYRAGDCFTYCATAHMLYARAGFQVMKIDRTAGYLRHYWNYVNYGEGWYHCDSSLHQSDGFEPFMLTTEEMIAYTTTVMNRPDYYVYDESLYPPCGNTAEPESTGMDPETDAPQEGSPQAAETEALGVGEEPAQSQPAGEPDVPADGGDAA